jgi:hypothetical protein
MKRLILLFSVVLFVAMPMLADCPEVFSFDDPPCAPECTVPVPLGAPFIVTLLIFEDCSELRVSLQTYIRCDETTYTEVVSGTLRSYCPNGPANPCMARALAP